MEKEIYIVQYGLGPIGLEAAKLVLGKKGLKLVGAIDIDENKVGRDLGEVLGLDANLGIFVSANPEQVLQETRPDVVLHSTGSFLNDVERQLSLCLEAGASIVSSCEELFYPFRKNPEVCERIDKVARKHKVALVGTGVNPGFSLDYFVLTATSVCTDIQTIRAKRVSNASKRRLPLQKKIGAGLSPDEFKNLVRQGKLGHRGLIESLHAVLDKIGIETDHIDEWVDPKIASKLTKTEFLTVNEGEVAGILHVAEASKNGRVRVRLELQMYVGAENESDSIEIEGQPPIRICVDGGIFGDQATIARMINAIPAIIASSPGLRSMMDLPLACYFE